MCPTCGQTIRGSMDPDIRARREREKRRVAALPRVECSCGATWLGKYTEHNPVIQAHRDRPSCSVTEVVALREPAEPVQKS
jgi:hypothetical protein